VWVADSHGGRLGRLSPLFRSRRRLEVEDLFLRHQLMPIGTFRGLRYSKSPIRTAACVISGPTIVLYVRYHHIISYRT
jgi:hypothetical protein